MSPRMSRLPVRGVRLVGDPHLSDDQWPRTIPAVGAVCRDGLDLGPATILVGENGSGKSTLVEAIAIGYGLSREGGSTGARHSTRLTESPLHEDLIVQRGAGGVRWGYFVRAETMHGLFSYLEDHPGRDDPDFHKLSHGESFLELLRTRRFADPGFFVLDEPEAGLSFTTQLALVGQLGEMVDLGAQVLIATHSPVIAALPGARLLQLDESGIAETTWENLAVVQHYHRFLDGPERYLRHLRG